MRSGISLSMCFFCCAASRGQRRHRAGGLGCQLIQHLRDSLADAEALKEFHHGTFTFRSTAIRFFSSTAIKESSPRWLSGCSTSSLDGLSPSTRATCSLR